MYTVDRHGYGEYLLDESRKIPAAHLRTVCLMGQGGKACRYIALPTGGEAGSSCFVCVKNCPLKDKIDLMVDMAKQGHVKFTARGDNCEGFGEMDGQENKPSPP